MSVDCNPQGFRRNTNFRSHHLLLAGARGLRVFRLLATRVALADAGRFATQATQVIELRPADSAALHEIDVIDDGGVQRKDSLDADAKARLSDGDRFARAAVLTSNHDAF